MMTQSLEQLPILLQKAREITLLQLRTLLTSFNLTEQQWRVLRTIFENGELNAQDLARKSAILGPSLSRILNRLEEDGLLNRKISAADQRELQLSLTAKGKRLHAKVQPSLNSLLDSLGQQLGQQRVIQLSLLLTEIIRVAQPQPPTPAFEIDDSCPF